MSGRRNVHAGHTATIVIPTPRPAPAAPGSEGLLHPSALSASASGVALSAATTALPRLSDYDLVEELTRAG